MADRAEEPLLTASRWTVPVSGVHVLRAEAFRIVRSEQEARETEVLAPRDPMGRVRLYDPMREPELLETLARLPLEAEAFAGFASRFGLLGLDPWMVSVSGSRAVPGGQPEPLARGELVPDWVAAVGEWQEAFSLWGGDPDSLREPLPDVRGEREVPRLEVQTGRALYSWARRDSNGRRVIGGDGSALAPLLDPKRPLRAAKLVLGELLNAKLRELTSWRVVFDAKADELVLRASSLSLLGAAWLQLAEAATGGRLQARRCLRCKRWIVADPSTERRFAKVYCSPTCRVAMAEKRNRARELAAAGKKSTEIAKVLGQDVKTVRAWLRPGA